MDIADLQNPPPASTCVFVPSPERPPMRARSSPRAACREGGAGGNMPLRASSWAGLGSAFGTNGTSKLVVASETTAVPALMPPESQQVGYHRFHTPITCVVPQAMMKVPNMRNIELNGRATNENRMSGLLVATAVIDCRHRAPRHPHCPPYPDRPAPTAARVADGESEVPTDAGVEDRAGETLVDRGHTLVWTPYLRHGASAAV